MLITQDSYEYLKTLSDYHNDIIYADPETATYRDWEMPTGDYWEKWFKEAYRTLKHGGYLIMFGMDRQLLLFKYYAHLSEFEEQQSLYWYFISNFPKATDLSKMIDKNLGEEREVIGIKKGVGTINNEETYDSGHKEVYDNTKPSSDLAKKYDGYKYSISPLKQTIS